MSDYRDINEILENFTHFFGKLSEEFEPKESYEIYRDKAKSADNLEDALNFMEKSISEAKKMITKSTFEQYEGILWLQESARPYIMMKKELAEIFVKFKLFHEAILAYFKVLELDSFDHLQVRFDLSGLLLNMKQYEDFQRLIDTCRPDESAFMLYSKSLYYFYKNDDINAKRYIKKALDVNNQIPKYLIGVDYEEFVDIENIKHKKEDEAKYYFYHAGEGWFHVKGSLCWLIDEVFLYANKNNIYMKYSKEDLKEKIKNIG